MSGVKKSNYVVKRLLKSSESITRSINSLCLHIESANDNLNNLSDDIIEEVKHQLDIHPKARKSQEELTTAVEKLKKLL